MFLLFSFFWRGVFVKAILGLMCTESSRRVDLSSRVLDQHLLDGDEVLQAFGHLAPRDRQVARVEEVPVVVFIVLDSNNRSVPTRFHWVFVFGMSLCLCLWTSCTPQSSGGRSGGSTWWFIAMLWLVVYGHVASWKKKKHYINHLVQQSLSK